MEYTKSELNRLDKECNKLRNYYFTLDKDDRKEVYEQLEIMNNKVKEYRNNFKRCCKDDGFK